MKTLAFAACLAAGAAFAQNMASVRVPAGASLPPSVAATATWQLATAYRSESFHTQNLVQFAQDVALATKGRLRIEVFPNNSLVKLADIAPAVASGKVHAGEVIMSALAKEAPIAGADSVPFVVSSYADAARIWQYQQAGVERAMAASGMTALYAVPWPPQGLYTNKPIKDARDFAGLKMRTYNPTTVRIAELLGSTAVDVPMVDVASALAEGRMDAMITSAVTGVENKVWGGLKHYYEIDAWFPKNLVFVNSKAFAALSAADQQAVRGAAQLAESRGWTLSQAAAANATDELRKNGIKVAKVPADFERELKRMGERFSREWIRSVGVVANEVFVPYYTQR